MVGLSQFPKSYTSKPPIWAQVNLVIERTGSPSHEVVEEVVHDLDEVHDGLAALDDLSVERALDVGLKWKNLSFKKWKEIQTQKSTTNLYGEKSIYHVGSIEVIADVG